MALSDLEVMKAWENILASHKSLGERIFGFARAIEAEARRDALTEAERICDYYATALDEEGGEYTRSRECRQAADAISDLKESPPPAP